MDGHSSEDSKQSTADMTVFIAKPDHSLYWMCKVFFNKCNLALDEMGNRVNELEQSINDLKAEMGVEGSPSPLAPSNQKSDEAKQEEGSA
ncbi:Hsbp1l1 [Gossypium arboreum]|uniref:Hsbp1l1 n=1 Tax=Gossypium arboreum TaxID=29729 RepID=A0A0B0NU96_GOSAR|nr:Hsbp1l1 [Gossypium arboreum]